MSQHPGPVGIAHPTREDPTARAASEVLGGPHGRRSVGHSWWTPVRVVLALACVGWLLAMVQKAPCAADHWSGDKTRYAQMCYSDVPYLYVGRGFAERRVPFTDSEGRYPDLEYPVLIGYFAWSAAVVTQWVNGGADIDARRAADPAGVYALPGVEAERQDYFLVTAVMLAPFALLTAYFLSRASRGRPWDAVAYAVAPVLVLTGLVNWDLLALTFVAGALWAWARGRPVLAGVMVGLGTATKLYPLFLLGAFLVVALRRRRLPDLGRAVAGALAAWLVVNLPAMLGDLDAWQSFWRFNSDRGPDLGSLWLVAAHLGHPASAHTINVVSGLGFAAVCVGVLVLGLRTRHVPRVAQLAYLVVVGFLLLNKVYSPQYVLWLLPLAVLARPRWRDLLIWQAGEILYFAAVWWYLGEYSANATSGGEDQLYSIATLVRVAAELYLAVLVVRDLLRPDLDPARLVPTPDGPVLDPDHDPLSA